MKRISIALIVCAITITACENNGSSTVGSYEREETQSTEHKEGHEKHEATEKHETSSDTTKSHISVDKNGVDVETNSLRKDSTEKH